MECIVWWIVIVGIFFVRAISQGQDEFAGVVEGRGPTEVKIGRFTKSVWAAHWTEPQDRIGCLEEIQQYTPVEQVAGYSPQTGRVIINYRRLNCSRFHHLRLRSFSGQRVIICFSKDRDCPLRVSLLLFRLQWFLTQRMMLIAAWYGLFPPV